MYFKYYGSKTPRINRAWVDELSASAHSSNGLLLSAEPPSPDAAARRAD